MLAVFASLALLQAVADAPLADTRVSEPLPVVQPMPVVEPAPPYKRQRSWVLPAIESEAFHFLFLAFNGFTRQEFAFLSWDSTKSHFDGRKPAEWDVDDFATNQFGHPYQGALSFLAARSSGHTFWTAALFPVVSSLTWELFFETEAPSFNDQIMTPVGGVFLGEVLIRVSRLLLDFDDEGRGLKSWLRRAGAFVLDPVGALNRLAFLGAYEPGDIEASPAHFGWVSFGGSFGTVARNPETLAVEQQVGLQGRAEVRLIYGPPGDPQFGYQQPFSHFDLELLVQAPGPLTLQLFTRGLLLGTQFGEAGSNIRGLWGLFGHYDLSIASLTRISAVGLGPGVAFQLHLAGDFYLHLSAMASGVPFASAGSLGLEGVEGVRDYHIGPGFHTAGEVALVLRDRGWLRVSAREWFCFGAYVPPSGWESVSYFSGGPMVRVLGPFGIALDGMFALRRSLFADQTFDRHVNAVSLALSLVYLSGSAFSVVEPR